MKRGESFYCWVVGFLLVVSLSCASERTAVRRSLPGSVRDNFVIRITPIPNKDKLELIIEASGTIQYTIFRLENPKRLVVDLPEIDSSVFSAPIEIGVGLASKIIAKHFPKTGNSRIEILLNEPVLYRVARVRDNRIVLQMSAIEKRILRDREVKPGEVEITAIELREMSGLARIVISYKGKKPKFEMVRKMEKKRIVLNIFGAKIMRANEKLLTVTAKDSVVENVAVFQFATKPKGVVKVLANLTEFTSSNAFARRGEIILDVGSEAILATASEVKLGKPMGVDISESREKRPDEWEGRKISLDFQGANIQNVIRSLADVSGYNIIISEKVAGKVNVKLRDVPWTLALDTILSNNRLGMTIKGNIIRVATIDELAQENKALAVTEEASAIIEKLYLKIFEVNYESVGKLKANLETIKSDRGTIDLNERTSTLIIQETKGKLAEMERLIEILDRRTVQVLIEARIVEVSTSHTRELGIRWGGYQSATTGYGFPNTVGLSGVVGGIASGAAGGLVNVPGPAAPTGALGIRLGSVNSTAMLDMQLFALQKQGKGRILSMPKIVTMNNKEAIIKSGREIPYQTVSAEGTETQFKKADLSLKVTPHVARDNFIRLEIEAKKDEPDFANALPAGVPIITKEAKTEVLVKDGDTTVIGGLFKENTSYSRTSVPFFSNLPLIGWMFRSRAEYQEGEELLIFITPRTF